MVSRKGAKMNTKDAVYLCGESWKPQSQWNLTYSLRFFL